MNEERGQVQMGTVLIPYRVERSSRRRAVSLQVRWQDGVTVKAPEDASSERLMRIVQAKASWLLARLSQIADCEPPSSRREYVAGESYRFLGRHYRLLLIKKSAPGGIEIVKEGSYLKALVPESRRGEEHKERMHSALVGWYQEQGRLLLPERVRVFAERAGVRPGKVLVREQGKRWGSCHHQRGELCFNWRLLMAPLPLVDYVVAHEVCHLREPDHSPPFWQLLGVILPDYEKSKERLRRQGPMFDL